jgi:hypothetical protein
MFDPFWNPYKYTWFVPLVVLWNPQIQTGDGSFGVQNNQFGFNITGASNIPIAVEACTNLASPVWIPLQSLTLTNGLFYSREFRLPSQSNLVLSPNDLPGYESDLQNCCHFGGSGQLSGAGAKLKPSRAIGAGESQRPAAHRHSTVWFQRRHGHFGRRRASWGNYFHSRFDRSNAQPFGLRRQ